MKFRTAETFVDRQARLTGDANGPSAGSDHTKNRAWSCSACPMALDRSYCADDLCLLRTGRSDRFQPGDTQAFAFLITEQITLGMQLLPYMAFGEKPRA